MTTVQVYYEIWLGMPIGIYTSTYGTGNMNFYDWEIAKKVEYLFDLRPYAIEQRLKLRTPIYLETPAYCHMGRECVWV